MLSCRRGQRYVTCMERYGGPYLTLDRKFHPTLIACNPLNIINLPKFIYFRPGFLIRLLNLKIKKNPFRVAHRIKLRHVYREFFSAKPFYFSTQKKNKKLNYVYTYSISEYFHSTQTQALSVAK